MTPASPFQHRKCERLLEADDLSRREQVGALAEIEGLEDWLITGATTPGFMPTTLEAVLVRLGSERVRLMVDGFFAARVQVV